MGLGEKWKLFRKYQQIYSSETFNETMEAVDQLARESLLLLDRKTEEEKSAIIGKVSELSVRLLDTAQGETPLVVGLALFTSLRTHHQNIQNAIQAAKSGKSHGQ
jgi:hypothetical protein